MRENGEGEGKSKGKGKCKGKCKGKSKGKSRPMATNFPFLKLLCPSGTALLQRSRVFEVALVGAKPLHLTGARPGCRSNAPLGRSLLRKRGPVGACLPQTLLMR